MHLRLLGQVRAGQFTEAPGTFGLESQEDSRLIPVLGLLDARDVPLGQVLRAELDEEMLAGLPAGSDPLADDVVAEIEVITVFDRDPAVAGRGILQSVGGPGLLGGRAIVCGVGHDAELQHGLADFVLYGRVPGRGRGDDANGDLSPEHHQFCMVTRLGIERGRTLPVVQVEADLQGVPIDPVNP
jgi:hypothetical protein